MCGCNSKNVSFAKGEVAQEAQYVVPRFKRSIRQSCDTFGNCGRLEENKFTSSEGVAAGAGVTVNFSDRRSTGSCGSNFPKESIYLSSSGQHLTAIGLRQLAEEFASVADQLDGQKTVVSIVDGAVVHTIRKKSKKKTTSKKKAKK